eukprot:COSAG01_NODE_6893_length_3448_cov_16.824425_2_plen_110_part_00
MAPAARRSSSGQQRSCAVSQLVNGAQVKAHTMRYPTRPAAAMLTLASVTCVIGGTTADFHLSNNTFGLANDTAVVTGMCVGNSNSSTDVICPPTFVARPNKTGASASIT